MVRIGISRCLLGEPVRWDGGHKRDAYLVDVFGPHVEWVPVCPELESGLPVPRPAMRLERADAGGPIVNGIPVKLVIKSGGEWTGQMTRWTAARVRELASDDVDGFVLKRDSPSCGVERVKVFAGASGSGERVGRGLFAQALLDRMPHLPIEEEGRLTDAALRENFIERVFAHARLRTIFAGRWTIGELVRFHTIHKLTLLAHQPAAYRALGRLVAEARQWPRAALRDEYRGAFMAALRTVVTPSRHVNVMHHMLGHLRGRLADAARDDLLRLIEEYRSGLLPVLVPLSLIQHYARLHGIEYLLGQTYLEPHPRELALRHHV